MNKLLITSLIFILTACAKHNPYKEYIGYWKLNDSNEILEIRKLDNKDEYMFLKNHAILKNEDGLNDKEVMEILDFSIGKQQIINLKKIPGERLAVENGEKIFPLRLDENANEIHADGNTLRKINRSEAIESLKYIYRCHKLALKKSEEQEEYNVDVHDLFYNETSDEEKQLKEAINNKYKELSKKIPECEL